GLVITVPIVHHLANRERPGGGDTTLADVGRLVVEVGFWNSWCATAIVLVRDRPVKGGKLSCAVWSGLWSGVFVWRVQLKLTPASRPWPCPCGLHQPYNGSMEPVSCAGCQTLQRRLRDLQAENERLRRQLDEATRAGQRQAAPFA